MKDVSILKPVFVQALLTFVVLLMMARERFVAFRAGNVVSNGPGTRPTWPGRAGTVSNAYHNLLEMPVLFYAVVALALFAGFVDGTMVALAWAFAGFRIVQAAVHTTYNYIPHRFFAFLLSNFVLMAMWGYLGLRVFLGW